MFSHEVAGSGEALWGLLADSPVDVRGVALGLSQCGLDPAVVCEVWCFSAQVEASARPLGLGPTVPVDMGQGLARAEVVRIALQVAAGLAPAAHGSR